MLFKTNAYNKCCTNKLKIIKKLRKKVMLLLRRCCGGRGNTDQRTVLSKTL